MSEAGRSAYEAAWTSEAMITLLKGGEPCEGCGKPGVVVDADGCDLCQECADGCRIPEGEAA